MALLSTIHTSEVVLYFYLNMACLATIVITAMVKGEVGTAISAVVIQSACKYIA